MVFTLHVKSCFAFHNKKCDVVSSVRTRQANPACLPACRTFSTISDGWMLLRRSLSFRPITSLVLFLHYGFMCAKSTTKNVKRILNFQFGGVHARLPSVRIPTNSINCTTTITPKTVSAGVRACVRACGCVMSEGMRQACGVGCVCGCV